MELKDMTIDYSKEFITAINDFFSNDALIAKVLEEGIPSLGEGLETESELNLFGEEVLFALEHPSSTVAQELKNQAQRAIQAKMLHKKWQVELTRNGRRTS